MKAISSCLLIISILLLGSLGYSQPSGGQPGPHHPQMPMSGPYVHKILSASSTDGLTWTRDSGIRLEHASVPCAIADGNRIILYYVDADRGQGKPESIGCSVSTDGIHFTKQPFEIKNLPTQKAVDPCVLKDSSGKFRLYYFASNGSGDPASQSGKHEIHLAMSDDGIHFKESGVAFSYQNLVDPDVFLYKGTWFMYVFGRGNTIIATSKDGLKFTYKQELALQGYGTVAPILLKDGRLRLYAFEQRKHTGNAFVSFISTDGLNWTRENGIRLQASDTEQITDPYVIKWKNGYKMFYKLEPRNPGGIPPHGTPHGEHPHGPKPPPGDSH